MSRHKGAQETAWPHGGLKTLTLCSGAGEGNMLTSRDKATVHQDFGCHHCCVSPVFPCDLTSRDGHGVILGDAAKPSKPGAALGSAVWRRSPQCSGGVSPSAEVRQPAPATASLLQPTKRLTLQMLGRTTLCLSSASSQRVSEKFSQVQGKICDFCGLGPWQADPGQGFGLPGPQLLLYKAGV